MQHNFSRLSIIILLSLSSMSYAAVEEKPEKAVPKPDIKAEIQKAEPVRNSGIPLDDPSIQDLVKTVQNYMTAWKKQDYSAMQKYESFDQDKKLELHEYIRAFDGNFGIGEWRVTRVFPELGQNEEYRVLVWLTHNPTGRVASFFSKGKKVRSTLTQWWRKQDDKYVHLYHVERRRLMNMKPPMPKATLPTQNKEDVKIPLLQSEDEKVPQPEKTTSTPE